MTGCVWLRAEESDRGLEHTEIWYPGLHAKLIDFACRVPYFLPIAIPNV